MLSAKTLPLRPENTAYAQELAINATKFGALSNETGQVEISWTVEAKESAEWLCLRWHEHGGPPVVAPSRTGYGTRLLQEGLEYDLDGAVTLDFEAGGLRYSVDVPIRMPE